jgi:hypothetical protein
MIQNAHFVPVPLAPYNEERSAKNPFRCTRNASKINARAGEHCFGKGKVESSIMS